MYPQKTSRACPRCGLPLLLIDVSVEKNEGSMGNVTTSTYACSDMSCRAKNNEEIDRMVKKKKEREEIHQKRIANMQANRKKSQKVA